jgi:hypothetical protein
MEKSSTNGEQKINEYVTRIQNGEPRATVLEGLSTAFVYGVEQQLVATTNQTEQVEGALESGEKTIGPENPPIVYSEIVIDDDYMEANLVQVGSEMGLRMQGGQANWNGEVEIRKYVISDNLSPQYRQTAAEKIEKHNAGLEKTYQHEAKHIRNRENGLTPHVAAESLREFLAFRVLDEMSAFATGELFDQEMTAETVINALRTAEEKVTSEYYGNPFTSDASWYMSQHGHEPETFTRQIDTERYHKIMRQYFNINGQDIFSILQRENKMPEFTNIINGLIGKLDQILASMKSKQL